MDYNYAASKLEQLLRDVRMKNYTDEEFWRQMSRIVRGSTGLPSAEELLEDVRYLTDAFSKTDDFNQMNSLSVPDQFVLAALHESKLGEI
tara:strand:- start:1078 stop:1347 length:270 start_codon:yes stop_codon:yes gene_type:complete